MPETKHLAVKDLNLDLRNFRTVPQKNEANSIHAMISINPDWFWALTHSLVDEGYHPTENIIVLKADSKGTIMTVKEGNRRIGALKIIYGLVATKHLNVPTDLLAKIAALPTSWKDANKVVPCAIYGPTESAQVDRIVNLTHGKGEKAGRDKWNPVAKARHNRDKNLSNEPALDLLEQYLKSGSNITPDQKERWGGEYPLSILEEAIKKIAHRIGASSSREVADSYPSKTTHRASLERVLHDVGLGTLDFSVIRDEVDDFPVKYGFPALQPTTGPGGTAGGDGGASNGDAGRGGSGKGAKRSGGKGGSNVFATTDPRSVRAALKNFKPKGKGREKLVTIVSEAKSLKLEKHPHAFCFLLRSMFELSAKAYCKDHPAELSATKKDGTDKTLVDLLREITGHLTQNKTDKAALKELHGAMAELTKPTGFLSVTSLNQLVHNPKFTVDGTHVSTLFNNIFPLLEAMSR